MIELFKYEPINLKQGPAFRLIRLLKQDGLVLKCELFESALSPDSCPPYEALSYTWGNPELVENIEVNHKTLWITENLYSALQCLRLPDQDRVLWVDGVCIDQSNIEERGHQVQLMKQIFSQSSRVIFWLGKPTYQVSLFMTAMLRFQAESEKHLCADWTFEDPRWRDLWSSIRTSPETIPLQKEGLQTLLDRAWFERVWIIQEVANATAAVVCCGIFAISAGIFALAPSLMELDIKPHCQSIVEIMPGLSRASDRSWWNGNRDLFTILQKFRDCRASDERDMIFALLGVSSDGQDESSIFPDYSKSPEKVFSDAMRYLMDSRGAKAHEILNFMKSLKTLSTSYVVWLAEQHQDDEELDLALKFGESRKSARNRLQSHTPLKNHLRVSRCASSLIIERHSDEVAHPMETCHAQSLNILMKSGMQLLPAFDNSTYAKSVEWGGHLPCVATWGEFGSNVLLLGIKNIESALELAQKHGHDRIAKVLIDRYFPVGAAQSRYQEQFGGICHKLLLGIFEGRSKKIMLHLLNNATISYSTGNWNQAKDLILATWSKKDESVERLINEGADTNTCVRWGNVHLSNVFVASYLNLPGIVRLLVDNGADANAPGSYYGNALQAASHRGCQDVVEILLESGADVNTCGGYYGNALQAASNGALLHRRVATMSWASNSRPADADKIQQHLVERLLQNGADVNASGGHYICALNAAVHAESEDVARILLQHGANSNTIGHDGDTLFCNALLYRSISMFRLLASHHADVNSSGQRRPLELALTTEMELARVGILLANGADVHVPCGPFGRSPLHTAISQNRFFQMFARVQMLIARGADVNKMDAYGRTPLYVAVRRRLCQPAWVNTKDLKVMDDTVELLRSQGAILRKEPWMYSPQLLQSYDDSRWLLSTSIQPASN